MVLLVQRPQFEWRGNALENSNNHPVAEPERYASQTLPEIGKRAHFQCLSGYVDENGTQPHVKCQWANAVSTGGGNLGQNV